MLSPLTLLSGVGYHVGCFCLIDIISFRAVTHMLGNLLLASSCLVIIRLIVYSIHSNTCYALSQINLLKIPTPVEKHRSCRVGHELNSFIIFINTYVFGSHKLFVMNTQVNGILQYYYNNMSNWYRKECTYHKYILFIWLKQCILPYTSIWNQGSGYRII